MDFPDVSIIIPTFNYGHLIEETLNSIICQSFENWECIIVDNGSTDNTKEIVSNWISKDSRFKFIKIEHTTTSSCRNKGLSASRGKFLQFVDADDQISEGKLKNQLELFNKNPTASIVYSNAMYYDHGFSNNLRYTLDESNKPWMIEFTGFSWDLLPSMLHKNVFVISSPLFKRRVYEETNGFNDAMNWVEDWEFYFRCFSKNYFVVFDNSKDSSSLIRVHPKSLSRNKIMMHEQSLLARNEVLITLNNIKKHPQYKLLEDDNFKHILFLHKSLAKEYASTSSFRSKKHLIKYSLKSKEYRFLLKVILSVFMHSKIEIPD
jgi:glycosyltransferase involved in cell wall biosynthesis